MLRKSLLLVAITLALSGGFAVAAAAGRASDITNPMCPVLLDEAVDPEVWVDYEGQRVGHAEEEAVQVPVDPEQRHDHETGHGQSEGPSRLVRFLGKFHPLAVHFPIALVLAALAAETLGALTRQSLFSDAARFSIVLAALSAMATAGLGWAAGAVAHYPGDLAETLWLHRWVGSGTGILIVVTAVLSEIAQRQEENGRTRRAYWVVLIFASLGVSVTGHLGASLIYGANYFEW